MTAAADLPYGATARTAAARTGVGAAARTSSSARIGVTPVARRRPALKLVAGVRNETPRAPFIAVVVALLVAGLLGLLVLNTVLAKDSFTLFALNQDTRVLVDREQSLAREVEALRAPQALAAKAAALGMVQAGPPAFLRLPDGAILGSASPALPPPAVLGPDGEVVPSPTTPTTTPPTVDAPADSSPTTDAAEGDR